MHTETHLRICSLLIGCYCVQGCMSPGETGRTDRDTREWKGRRYSMVYGESGKESGGRKWFVEVTTGTAMLTELRFLVKEGMCIEVRPQMALFTVRTKSGDEERMRFPPAGDEIGLYEGEILITWNKGHPMDGVLNLQKRDEVYIGMESNIEGVVRIDTGVTLRGRVPDSMKDRPPAE